MLGIVMLFGFPSGIVIVYSLYVELVCCMLLQTLLCVAPITAAFWSNRCYTLLHSLLYYCHPTLHIFSITL